MKINVVILITVYGAACEELMDVFVKDIAKWETKSLNLQ